MEHLGSEGNLQSIFIEENITTFFFFKAMIKILRIVTMVESNDFWEEHINLEM